jgi:hypothetical protein
MGPRLWSCIDPTLYRTGCETTCSRAAPRVRQRSRGLTSGSTGGPAPRAGRCLPHSSNDMPPRMRPPQRQTLQTTPSETSAGRRRRLLPPRSSQLACRPARMTLRHPPPAPRRVLLQAGGPSRAEAQSRAQAAHPPALGRARPTLIRSNSSSSSNSRDQVSLSSQLCPPANRDSAGVADVLRHLDCGVSCGPSI